MPRNIRTYTVCAPPGVAKSHKQLGGLRGFVARLITSNPWYVWLPIVLAILVALFLAGAATGPVGWAAVLFELIYELIQLKHWYYEGRLLCIRADECAVGTVLVEPEEAFDGDRKLDIMLAPFIAIDWHTELRQHLTANETMLTTDANFVDPPFHSVHPLLPDELERDGDFGTLQDYMETLRSIQPDGAEANMFRQILIGVVDRVMSDANRNFFNRFFRKDPAHIPLGSELWNAIPVDNDLTVQWDGTDVQSTARNPNPYENIANPPGETLNPMFRCRHSHLVPELHCEIDGNRIQLLIDLLISVLLGMFAAAIVLFTEFGPDILPDWLPDWAWFILFLLFVPVVLWNWWGLNELFGNLGTADDPDVVWEDPAYETPQSVTSRPGDIVVEFGDWIMDTEHHQYFEIHPVRAFFLIAHSPDRFDQTTITSAVKDFICSLVTHAEQDQLPPTHTVSASTALSYGLATTYGGGGAQEP